MTTYRAPLQHNPQREKGVRGVRPWERLENVRKEKKKKVSRFGHYHKVESMNSALNDESLLFWGFAI